MASQQELPAGATIYEAGDVSKGAYLIQSGKVDLMTAENFRLVTLGAGEMFGELGLVIDDFRSVTAVTRTECALILIPKETLEKSLKLPIRPYEEFLDPWVFACAKPTAKKMNFGKRLIGCKKTASGLNKN